MIRNYLATALRHLLKHRLYSLINVLGLAIGLAAFLLIGLFVRYELTYDQFHDDVDRLYRVVKADPGNFYLGTNHFAVTPVPLPDALEAEIPGVERATQINDVTALLGVGENSYFEDGLWATESFFDIFTFPLLEGNQATALAEPNTIVLTESIADKLFGTRDVMGRSISMTQWDDVYDMEVTGLVADPPLNSHFSFGYIVSLRTSASWVRGADHWDNNSWYTYFRAAEGTDPAVLGERIAAMGKEKLGGLEWYQDNPERITNYYIQPVSDIHLRSHINFEIGTNGDIKFVYIFSAVALFILLIACVNYMNLATARSASRAREIGVRKASGAERGQLILQFLGESFLTTALSVVVAIGAVTALMPWFRGLGEREMPGDLLFSGSTLVMALAGAAVVALVAGSYPALVMSRLEASLVLKGSRSSGGKKPRLRNALVVAQFAIGIVLIVGTLVIRNQLTFMSSAETGLDREQVLAIRARDMGVSSQYGALASELRAIPGVVDVSSSGHLPMRVSSQSTTRRWDGNETEQRLPIYNTSVNIGYAELLDLELVEGRTFSEDFLDEGVGILINETAMRAAGWDTAVGKTLDMGSRGSTVVGVLKDYHFHSFRQPIEPLVLYLDTDRTTYILVRLAPGQVSETVDRVGEAYATFSPEYPFEYQFLDDAYDSMYRADRKFGKIFGYFTAVALAIACLGLFALAAFMAEQRTKEIGVRKVLGATSSDIVVLLSREFGRLVLIALILAGPISWVVMDRWLEDFAFRTAFGWQTILMSGLLALMLAWLTVGYQSLKASRANPVESLRYE